MFEYQGNTYTIQDLQQAAIKRGMDFNSYLNVMKNVGLKQIGDAEQDSTIDSAISQQSIQSDLDGGSSDSVSWFDQTWFGRGVKAASTTGEATNLMSEDFSNISAESIQEFIKAKEEEARTYVESERMKKFQKKYKEEGSTWSAFFRGVKDQPGLLPELFVQSLGTQIGTLIDSPGASLAAAGTGAAGGAAVGAVPGAIAGFMGGLATSMEAALTFGELIETRLKEKGQEFTDENIKALLETEGREIRNKALGRGLAIGTIEGFSGGLAGKTALATKTAVGATRGAKTATLAAGAAGTIVEAVGGATGEIAGRAVAGQEMDAAEIGFEAITGTVTAPANVGAALLTAKKPTYSLNGEEVTYEQMKDFVDTADDMDIAKANIQMENDFTGIGKKAKAKQEAVRTMVKLSGDEATIAEVGEVVAEENYQANMAFAKKHVDLYGLKFTELTKEEIAERFGKDSDLINALGTVSGDEIIINKDNAKTQEYGDNVGNHELLHGIIKASGANISEQTINEFRSIIGAEADAAIQKRIDTTVDKNGNKVYDEKYLSENRDEYFTMFSDAIEAGEIKFNDSVFTKIRDLFRRMFAGLGVSNVNFNDAQSTYNFLKDYNRSIHKGALSSGLKKATKGKAVFDTMDKKSVSVERRNQISSSIQEIGSTYAFEGGKTSWDQGGADQAITEIKDNNYLDDLIASKYKADRVPVDFVDKVYSELTSHIKNFNPETNDNLFGWINSQLANKAGNVFNREYKQAEQEKTAKDVDDRTKEGEVKVQVAAETDTALEAFEQEDISPAAEARKRKEQQDKKPEYSKFRRKLGIETDSDLYNSILDAARKALIRAYESGKPARNIQRNLRDEANTYLFKTVKNFLGTKQYINNLKKFRESIMEVMFVADLVQLERNVPDEQRVFTKFVKKLTSKAEVQKAVNENKLPTSALNIIDKGTAVNLYEKANPTEEQFLSYFNIPAFNPATGQRSGKRGTRKDQLAKYMSGALAYDATMQVAQENEVIQKRQDIADLKNLDIPADDLQVLSDVINRPINVKFSVSPGKLKKDITIESNNIEYDSQGLFLGVVLNGLNQGPEKAIELGYMALSNQTINFADKAFLAKVIKEGVVDKNYIKNVLKQIKKVTVKEIKEYGYNATLSRLDNRLEQAVDNEERTNIITQFLINESKSIRTSKADGITRNRQVYDNILSPLLDKYNITGFSVVELKNAKGETRTFKDKDGNNIPYTKIALNGEEINTYTKVTDIKRNFAEYKDIINSEAQQAINYILDIAKDNSLSVLERKAIIKLLTTDQVGSFRKISKAGMYIEGLPTKETTLDHEYTINDLYQATLNAIDGKISFDALENIFNNSKVNLITKKVDEQLNESGLKSTGSDRMFDNKVRRLIDKDKRYKDTQKVYGNDVEKQSILIGKAVKNARTPMSYSNKKRGMSTFDFDETLIDKGDNFIVAKKGEETIKISSGQWPILGPALTEQGYEFDFSDFTNVRGGVEGPLLQKMRNQIKKFGAENVFVLTARPPQSAQAIHDWLKSKNINIPRENITGLGNSTGEAKAAWMLEKFSEGYNDMYFVDDALPNVKAVKHVLEQLDVKSKVVQARTKFSVGIDKKFNDILEDVTGIESKKRFSDAKARKRGSGKGRFRVFVPPSHEDFVGLLYNFIGEGEQGNQHRDFFEQALVKPLNRAYRELNMAKQAIANDYRNLIKQMPDIRKKLTESTPDGDFNYDDAVRVYLWNKFGFDVPGLTKTDTNKLIELVNLDQKLRMFADKVGQISKMDEGYIEPGEHWLTGSIKQDLADATGRVGRAKFFTEFIENADIIFNQENINKIRAAYGDNFVEALQDMLSRVKTGTNRKQGGNRQVNAFLDYLNGSIGATMFFNARSAVLQTLSTVNFINYGDNNIFKAAARFADQGQFWSDFSLLFNSDFLKQRRAGVGFDVNGAEIASAVKKAKNPVKATIAYILNKGFLPTQMADSFAIALGGASMYRNRVNTYVKQGLPQSEAETKAFNDFMETAEATQQSARPDMISQQQASVLGRMILAFQNVTSQYTRLIKKAGLDLINRRKTPPYTTQVQSDMSNISKIIYYGAVQNVIFYGLQSALFAMAFEDDEDQDKKNEKFFKTKKERLINGSIDSILRGSGVGGAVISVLKNAVIKYGEQKEKGWGKQLGVISDELLQLSPPVGIKLRKIDSFEKTMEFNKKVIPEMDTFDLDNPIWDAYGNLVEGLTNVPVARLLRKVENVRSAIDSENAWWQRLALGLGWSKWELGIEDKEIKKVKENIKNTNKQVNKGKKIKRIPGLLN